MAINLRKLVLKNMFTYLSIFKFLFIGFREEGRGREKHDWFVPPIVCIFWLILMCALTGDNPQPWYIRTIL